MPSRAKDIENRIADAGRSVTPTATEHPAGESQAARGVAASCEIPLEVHGSQKAGSQYHTVVPFHEETRTVIVFPHGCVLRLSTPVAVGQMLALTNQNTQRGMLSKVTHVRTYPNLKSYVEIEFTQIDPGFWSINFEEEVAAQGYEPAAGTSGAAAPANNFWEAKATDDAVRASVKKPRESGSELVGSGESVAPVAKEKTAVLPPPMKAPVTATKGSSAKIARPAANAKETVRAKEVKRETEAPWGKEANRGAEDTRAKEAGRAKDSAPAAQSSKPERGDEAAEFSLAPQPEKTVQEAPPSQAWAELLVMEPQQQLQAHELSTSRSDVEESLAPAPVHEHDAPEAARHPAAAAGPPPVFDAGATEHISESVLKELEKLAMEHVGEKGASPHAAGGAQNQVASEASHSAKTRTDSRGKSAEQSRGSHGASRPSPLHTFTAGASKHESVLNPLHSFTGTPPVHSEAEALPGVIEGVNPHKTQTLADHSSEGGGESDFGNFLRDPEPRTAAARVYTGPAEAIAPRTSEAHLHLAPLRVKPSRSGLVFAIVALIAAGVALWWFYPLRGAAPLSGVVPAASAPAPGSSPAQWPSQSPTDAATLDSSGGHPVVVEPRSSNSDGSSPAAAPAAEPRTQPEGGGREIIPVPQAAGNPAGRAVSSHPSSVASRGSLPEASLAAPISTGSAAARVSADPPPNVSGADAGRARANNLGGIVGSAPVNVPAPARAVPAAPITVGGRVQEPRLISSVPPIYPQTAIQANVQGDVKIQATIDETGRVTKMRVISGPPLLQRAAMDALRQWRYEPSRLDDQPVAVDMAVTVRFRR